MGLNLDSAPIEILESVAVTRQDLDIHHKALVLHAGGGVILSTCNRTEIYSISLNPDRGLRQLIEYLDILMRRGDKKLNLAPYIYTFTDDDVVRHLFSVTSGLGSPAIGESEVAGQVSNALKVAAENGAVVSQISRVFHAALRNSRRIRKNTGLGRDSLSIPSIALKLIRSVIGDLREKNVLVIGAGDMGRLTARTLKHVGVREIIVSSRTVEKAELLVEELDGKAIPFECLEESLQTVDVVITCTASTKPVLFQKTVNELMSMRRDRQLVIMDLGMPRDVDKEVGAISGIQLYSLAELQKISKQHGKGRKETALEANSLIEKSVKRFKEQMIATDREPLIRDLAVRAEIMRDSEMRHALQNMPDLDPEYIEKIDIMSKALVKKMLADPIAYLRSQDTELTDRSVADVFGLEPKDS